MKNQCMAILKVHKKELQNEQTFQRGSISQDLLSFISYILILGSILFPTFSKRAGLTHFPIFIYNCMPICYSQRKGDAVYCSAPDIFQII